VQYRDFNKELGKTGAGLEYDDIIPGSDIHNLIGTFICNSLAVCDTNPDKDKLLEGFPYWERLHGYWRTLPNYNPITVTSDPGQDLESDAVALFGAVLNGDSNEEESVDSLPDADELTPEEQAEIELDADANADDDLYTAFNGVSSIIPSSLCKYALTFHTV